MRYAVNEVLLLARLCTVRIALLVEAGKNLLEAFDRVRLDVMSQGLCWPPPAEVSAIGEGI